MKRLGPYEVREPIGHGGMGAVYHAVDTRGGRAVALKVLRSVHGPGARQRFAREAEVLRTLRHPAIVDFLDAGEENGQPFVVMELVAGGSLEDRLAKGPLPEVEAVALVARLARAVAYAHEHGVLHRDLKPANVLLAAEGAKLGDFGLARIEGDAERLSRTGDLVGTLGYMAPEQAEGRRDAGEATDVYGLGALLYAALTGVPPIDEKIAVDALVATASRAPARPSRIRATLSREVEVICLRCLEKNPAARFATASELAAALERHVAGAPPRRALPVLAGLAGLAVIAGTVALVAGAPRRDPMTHAPVAVVATTTRHAPPGPAAPDVAVTVSGALATTRGWDAYAVPKGFASAEALSRLEAEALLAYLHEHWARIVEVGGAHERAVEAPLRALVAAGSMRVAAHAFVEDKALTVNTKVEIDQRGMILRPEYKAIAFKSNGYSFLRFRFALDATPARGLLLLRAHASGTGNVNFSPLDVTVNGEAVARCVSPALGSKESLYRDDVVIDLGRTLVKGQDAIEIRQSPIALTQCFLWEATVLVR